MKVKDETGNRYGRLLVIAISESRKRKARWVCQCDCGATAIVTGDGLRQNKSISCGCLKKERIGSLNKKHGKSDSKIHNIWLGIRQRCFDEGCVAFKNYGGRGITMSDEWMDFKAFYRDMGDPPPAHWIERKDNDGPYSKDNCTWEPRIVQMQNQRKTIRVEVDGVNMSMFRASSILGIKYGRIKKMMKLDGLYKPGIVPYRMTEEKITALRSAPCQTQS